jgi:hypothetical protein
MSDAEVGAGGTQAPGEVSGPVAIQEAPQRIGDRQARGWRILCACHCLLGTVAPSRQWVCARAIRHVPPFVV